MSRASRRKGAAGEREVAQLLRMAGFKAIRDGRLLEDLQHNVPDVHFEIKRCERLSVPAWWRQAVRDAGERVPILVYRTSRSEWLCEMPLTYYVAEVLPGCSLVLDGHIDVYPDRKLLPFRDYLDAIRP